VARNDPRRRGPGRGPGVFVSGLRQSHHLRQRGGEGNQHDRHVRQLQRQCRRFQLQQHHAGSASASSAAAEWAGDGSGRAAGQAGGPGG